MKAAENAQLETTLQSQEPRKAWLHFTFRCTNRSFGHHHLRGPAATRYFFDPPSNDFSALAFAGFSYVALQAWWINSCACTQHRYGRPLGPGIAQPCKRAKERCIRVVVSQTSLVADTAEPCQQSHELRSAFSSSDGSRTAKTPATLTVLPLGAVLTERALGTVATNHGPRDF